MVPQVISQGGICFLSPPVLGFTVRHLEENFPGWWWSISQSTEYITLSIAPTKQGVLGSDVAMASTRFGDNGFIYSFYYKDVSVEKLYLEWLVLVCAMLETHRKVATHSLNVIDVEFLPTRRSQSMEDLAKLANSYTMLLTKIDAFETAGMLFKEVYIGSCEHSVDCSLRGTNPHLVDDTGKTTFDYTCDIEDPNTSVGESVIDCVSQMEMAILDYLPGFLDEAGR